MRAETVGEKMDRDVEDAYLVRRAQEGYLDAFETLVQRYAGLAYRVAYRLLADHHHAQDIAQESLTAAWQHLPRFRAEASFSTWLYRMVTRRALNHLTRGRIPVSADLLAEIGDDDGPARRTERNLTRDAVLDAVAALPQAQRIVIVLHQFEGLSYAETAAVTHSSVPSVRSHLFRARRTLASILEEWR